MVLADSPRELYRSHESGTHHERPVAGMKSRSLHRHDFVRPTQPNPHMLECNDYLLHNLVQHKDPLIGKHGRPALEVLVAETCGYHALPGEHHVHKENAKSARDALKKAGNTHGILAKSSCQPAWPRRQNDSTDRGFQELSRKPKYASSEAPSERSCASRPASDCGGPVGGYPSPSAPRSPPIMFGRASRSASQPSGAVRGQTRPSPNTEARRPSSGGSSGTRRCDNQQRSERQDRSTRPRSAGAQTSDAQRPRHSVWDGPQASLPGYRFASVRS